MRDIVDQLRDYDKNGAAQWKAPAIAANEIETLRQKAESLEARVKELEAELAEARILMRTYHDEAFDCEKELATLKGSQQASIASGAGEPMAYMHKVTGELDRGWDAILDPDSWLPLYTSPAMLAEQAPCDIPEGWQLVPKELTDAMVDKGIDAYQDVWNSKDRGRFNAEQQLRAAYDAMLAAAPKCLGDTSEGKE